MDRVLAKGRHPMGIAVLCAPSVSSTGLAGTEKECYLSESHWYCHFQDRENLLTHFLFSRRLTFYISISTVFFFFTVLETVFSVKYDTHS